MIPISGVQEYTHPDGPPPKETHVPSIRFEQVEFEGRDVYILDGDFVLVGQGKAALKKALDIKMENDLEA
jgi:arginine deiminase